MSNPNQSMQTTKHVDSVGTCGNMKTRTRIVHLQLSVTLSQVFCLCVSSIRLHHSCYHLGIRLGFDMAICPGSAGIFCESNNSLYCSNGGSSCQPIIFVRINDCALKVVWCWNWMPPFEYTNKNASKTFPYKYFLSPSQSAPSGQLGIGRTGFLAIKHWVPSPRKSQEPIFVCHYISLYFQCLQWIYEM